VYSAQYSSVDHVHPLSDFRINWDRSGFAALVLISISADSEIDGLFCVYLSLFLSFRGATPLSLAVTHTSSLSDYKWLLSALKKSTRRTSELLLWSKAFMPLKMWTKHMVQVLAVFGKAHYHAVLRSSLNTFLQYNLHSCIWLALNFKVHIYIVISSCFSRESNPWL